METCNIELSRKRRTRMCYSASSLNANGLSRGQRGASVSESNRVVNSLSYEFVQDISRRHNPKWLSMLCSVVCDQSHVDVFVSEQLESVLTTNVWSNSMYRLEWQEANSSMLIGFQSHQRFHVQDACEVRGMPLEMDRYGREARSVNLVAC